LVVRKQNIKKVRNIFNACRAIYRLNKLVKQEKINKRFRLLRNVCVAV
jgi:hypothetical protein